jgi:hypothetical protein
MSRSQSATPSLFTQVDINPTAGESLLASPQDSSDEQARLLRGLLAAQDRTNELLEELLSQLAAPQRQRVAELNQWKQANPSLSRACRLAAESLGRAQTAFIESLADEVQDNSQALLDGDFLLNEFIDRFGPRLAHINGLLQVLSQLGSSAGQPNPSSANS